QTCALPIYRLAAGQLAFVGLVAQQRAPAARPGVAGAGAIGVDLDLLHQVSVFRPPARPRVAASLPAPVPPARARAFRTPARTRRATMPRPRRDCQHFRADASAARRSAAAPPPPGRGRAGA